VHFAGKALLALLTAARGAASVAGAPPNTALPLQDGQILAVSSVRLPADTAAAAATRQILEEVAITAITYASDGLRVKGYLAVPKKGEHLPAVIFNRGGNRAFAQLSAEDAVRRLGGLARWGYVVAASQYRGNDGGEGKEEFGGADIDDVLNLIPLLGSLSKVDATRIGMYGWSRGGMMTYLALARTDRIAAAVVSSGVSDLPDMLARRPEMEDVFLALIPDYRERKEEALAARSAVRWAERLNAKTPILILAGTADWRVHPKQALDMSAALLEAKHPFRLVVFEGGEHGLSEYREEVDRLVRDWLDRYVRDRKPWPGLDPHGD
jgi:dipeptidyl aminopeptidase/acylaminoacyl peptidase